jgi:hypothetical protein
MNTIRLITEAKLRRNVLEMIVETRLEQFITSLENNFKILLPFYLFSLSLSLSLSRVGFLDCKGQKMRTKGYKVLLIGEVKG